MPTITTNDGAKIFYTDKGSGKPLVMLAGWGCSTNFFKKNSDELAKTCRVINMDLRAHGESENVMHGHRIARYAADLKDLIEALDLHDVTILGWSMGASVCWSYVELFGNYRLKGHVSVDQSPKQYYDEAWRYGQPGCYDAEALAILTIRLEYDAASVARGLVPACVGDVYKPTAEEVEYLASEIDKCPAKVRAMIMADHTGVDWRDFLPTMKLPVLVTVGRQSKVFPWQGSAWVAENVPGAKVVFFEQSGHMPFYEEPEKWNKAVSDFVNS